MHRVRDQLGTRLVGTGLGCGFDESHRTGVVSNRALGGGARFGIVRRAGAAAHAAASTRRLCTFGGAVAPPMSTTSATEALVLDAMASCSFIPEVKRVTPATWHYGGKASECGGPRKAAEGLGWRAPRADDNLVGRHALCGDATVEAQYLPRGIKVDKG